MARDRAFSDEQVIHAANELIIENKAVNGTSLRNKVGAGRPSALLSVFNELMERGDIEAKSSAVQVELEVKSIALPPEIGELLSVVLADVEAMIHRINDQAHYVVEQRLNNAIAEANKRVSEAAKRQADVESEMELVFNQIEDMRDESNDLREANQSFQSTINDQNLKLSEVLKDLQTSQRDNDLLNKNIEDLELKYKLLNGDLVAAEKDKSVEVGKNLTLSEELAVKEQHIQNMKISLDKANQSKSEALGELKAQTKQFDSMKVSLDKANQAKSEALGDLKAQAKQFDSMKVSLDEANQAKSEALGELKAQTKQFGSMKISLDKANQAKSEALGELKAQTKQFDLMKISLDEANQSKKI